MNELRASCLGPTNCPGPTAQDQLLRTNCSGPAAQGQLLRAVWPLAVRGRDEPHGEAEGDSEESGGEVARRAARHCEGNNLAAALGRHSRVGVDVVGRLAGRRGRARRRVRGGQERVPRNAGARGLRLEAARDTRLHEQPYDVDGVDRAERVPSAEARVAEARLRRTGPAGAEEGAQGARAPRSRRGRRERARREEDGSVGGVRVGRASIGTSRSSELPSTPTRWTCVSVGGTDAICASCVGVMAEKPCSG